MPKKSKSTSFGGQKVTPAGKRHLEERAPKLKENPKKLLGLRASKTSEQSTGALKALAGLAAPHSKMLSRKRDDMRPFEDASAVEAVARKEDCSLFGVASHSKKRPHSLTLGRLHDGHLLDMYEFGVVAAGGAYRRRRPRDSSLVHRGDAAACDANTPWRRVAATPRLATRIVLGRIAAATRIVL